ncbi:MAG: hypothetical protein IJE59_00180 [Clostridia bacterium]|nr:hypothetical protein [Clostridia bacterium]
MKVLLDTNIIIHRETDHIINNDIGILFRWLDRLKYDKCIHSVTRQELEKYKNKDTKQSMMIKIDSYYELKVITLMDAEVIEKLKEIDVTENDKNDSKILNEVYKNKVDILITEDRKIHTKAQILGISDKVFSINSFLEKVIAENPELVDYKTLAVQKEYFGEINIEDEFFESLKNDYDDFINWFNRKSEEQAYVCKDNGEIKAFLYLKNEDEEHDYSDIFPKFEKKKRMKVGTFKVALNGYKLGERFIKIIFDNAISSKVDEIYVTIFDKTEEQKRLIELLEEYGFKFWGKKNGIENVYVRKLDKVFNRENPKKSYPYIPKEGNVYFCSIYPAYHTELFPDSMLSNESPEDFLDNRPHRNAIKKVYITRAFKRDLKQGDVIIFYRTGGRYAGVITTIGIVENINLNIRNSEEFLNKCRKRSVFSDKKLLEHWNYNPNSRPFIVNFITAYSFPKKLNLDRLIELGVFEDAYSIPRGFGELSNEHYKLILKETDTNIDIIA